STLTRPEQNWASLGHPMAAVLAVLFLRDRPGGAEARSGGQGRKWMFVTSGVQQDLYRVFAVSPNLAWAIGDEGRLLTWNGSWWNPGTFGTKAPMATLWASSTRDAWAAAVNGQLYHWDGTHWSEVRIHSVDVLKNREACASRILGFGPHDIWLFGCTTYHYDGRSWRRDELGARRVVWATSSTNIYRMWSWGDKKLKSDKLPFIHQSTYDHWDGKQIASHEFPVWPCNQPHTIIP
ncbi:MAG: hypothetical protein ACK2U9_10525, partial [Anaerolineae bacterium]